MGHFLGQKDHPRSSHRGSDPGITGTSGNVKLVPSDLGPLYHGASEHGKVYIHENPINNNEIVE